MSKPSTGRRSLASKPPREPLTDLRSEAAGSRDRLSLDHARYEVKMVVQGSSFDRVMTELRLLPAALRTLHPPRRVSSIYLDTHEGRAFEENLSGTSHRRKYRFRWYGGDCGAVPGKLELKIRNNMLGWKEQASLSEPMKIEGAPRHRWLRRLSELLEPEWRQRIIGLEAVQWISYTRRYLVTADRRVRVTVDRHLESSNQRERTRLSSRFTTPIPDVTIVECKTPVENYDALERLLRTMPLVADKCSKFVIATDPSAGPTVSMLQA